MENLKEINLLKNSIKNKENYNFVKKSLNSVKDGTVTVPARVPVTVPKLTKNLSSRKLIKYDEKKYNFLQNSIILDFLKKIFLILIMKKIYFFTIKNFHYIFIIILFIINIQINTINCQDIDTTYHHTNHNHNHHHHNINNNNNHNNNSLNNNNNNNNDKEFIDDGLMTTTPPATSSSLENLSDIQTDKTTNLTINLEKNNNFLREHIINVENRKLKNINHHNHNNNNHHHQQHPQQQHPQQQHPQQQHQTQSIYTQKIQQYQQRHHQQHINNDSNFSISDDDIIDDYNDNDNDDNIDDYRNINNYDKVQQQEQHQMQENLNSITSTTPTITNGNSDSKLSGNTNKKQYINISGNNHNNNNNNNHNSDNINGCQGCRLREEIKAASLQSIKAHVLQKLRLTHPPNMTIIPKVPQIIVNNFYNQTGYEYNNNNNNNNGGADGGNNGNNDDITIDDHMFGDDPHIFHTNSNNYYYGNKFESGPEIIEEDDDFYSITDRIYAISTITRIRHNRKNADILKFRFNTIQHTIVTGAILNLNLNTIETIRHLIDQNLFNKIMKNNYNYNYNLTINRVVISPLQPDNYHFRIEKEFTGNLQTAYNKNLIQIDVTAMVNDWFQNSMTNNGIIIKIHDPLMRKLIIIDDNNNENVPFIEIVTKDTRKRRTKRNIALNCHENDKENRCCRYPLTVDFEKFGWDWIIAPKRYDANYCRGECTISFLQQYPHTHIMQLSSSAQPCCSPKKMSHLKLLYFDMNYNIVYSHIPNMIVDKCSCA